MLTDLQVSRIFHLYCGCSVVSYTNGSPYLQKLLGVQQGDIYVYSQWDYIRNYKLALKKLQDITDEDAIEVTKIILPMCFETNAKYWRVSRDFAITGWPYIRVHNNNKVYALQIDCTLCNFSLYDMEESVTDATDMAPAQVTQYLIQQGYAVPLFIEVGHPDNGKTTIELEVAVDIATIKQAQQ